MKKKCGNRPLSQKITRFLLRTNVEDNIYIAVLGPFRGGHYWDWNIRALIRWRPQAACDSGLRFLRESRYLVGATDLKKFSRKGEFRNYLRVHLRKTLQVGLVRREPPQSLSSCEYSLLTLWKAPVSLRPEPTKSLRFYPIRNYYRANKFLNWDFPLFSFISKYFKISAAKRLDKLAPNLISFQV